MLVRCSCFGNILWLFYVLHDPTFAMQYASFRDQPKSMPLSWLALLAIVCTAVTALEPSSTIMNEFFQKDTAIGQIAELAERHSSPCIKCREADNHHHHQREPHVQHQSAVLQALLFRTLAEIQAHECSKSCNNLFLSKLQPRGDPCP